MSPLVAASPRRGPGMMSPALADLAAKPKMPAKNAKMTTRWIKRLAIFMELLSEIAMRRFIEQIILYAYSQNRRNIPDLLDGYVIRE